MKSPDIEALGDNALLIRLADVIDDDANDRAIALADSLRTNSIVGMRDVAPAYASVCVRYDAATTTFDAISSALRSRMESIDKNLHARDNIDVVEIPVCYGGEFGPDLEDVARHCGLDAREVIERHSRALYTVAMIGFMPGFPYLRGLDPSLHTPRRADPRTQVPAGSVAIGGAHTGIYPRELPGGWQLIGRTPLALFDVARSSPALLRAGQRVRFRAIDAVAFEALAK